MKDNPSGWNGQSEILVGHKSDTEEYRISDFIAAGGNNVAYAYGISKNSPVSASDISNANNQSTSVLMGGSGKVDKFYNVQFSGVCVADLNLSNSSGYYKEGEKITIVDVPVGYDYKFNDGNVLASGQKIDVSTLAGEVNVSKTPWTFTYMFKTAPTRDASKNTLGIPIQVKGNGGEVWGYTTTSSGITNPGAQEVKIEVTFGKENSTLDYFTFDNTLKTLSTDIKEGSTVRFVGLSKDAEGKNLTTECMPESNGEEIILYVQWKPIRIVLAGFSNSIFITTGPNGLTYSSECIDDRRVEHTNGQIYNVSPYMREGDKLVLTKTDSGCHGKIIGSDGKTFMEFDSTVASISNDITINFSDMVDLNWTIQSTDRTTQYYPLLSLYPGGSGSFTNQSAVFLKVGDYSN